MAHSADGLTPGALMRRSVASHSNHDAASPAFESKSAPPRRSSPHESDDSDDISSPLLEPTDVPILRHILQRIECALRANVTRVHQPQRFIRGPDGQAYPSGGDTADLASFVRLGGLWRVAKVVNGEVMRLKEPIVDMDIPLDEMRRQLDWLLQEVSEAAALRRAAIDRAREDLSIAEQLKEKADLSNDEVFKKWDASTRRPLDVFKKLSPPRKPWFEDVNRELSQLEQFQNTHDSMVRRCMQYDNQGNYDEVLALVAAIVNESGLITHRIQLQQLAGLLTVFEQRLRSLAGECSFRIQQHEHALKETRKQLELRWKRQRERSDPEWDVEAGLRPQLRKEREQLKNQVVLILVVVVALIALIATWSIAFGSDKSRVPSELVAAIVKEATSTASVSVPDVISEGISATTR